MCLAGLPSIIAARSNVIGWVTSLILLPLCMLKSFEKLAPFSILGIMGTLFTAGVLGLRAVDGTYRPGGVFYEVRPSILHPAIHPRQSHPSSYGLCRRSRPPRAASW